MILLEIEGLPTAWSSHGGHGRRSFNPRFREKAYAQWQIKAQYNQQKPLSCAVKVTFIFHMPIPFGTSKIRRLQMLNDKIHHTKRPDTTNLQKFAEDCLKGIVLEDDSQVVEVSAKKIYGENSKTVLRIESLNV
jgi:Holliday junction resolvase RusA-like endonuclease